MKKCLFVIGIIFLIVSSGVYAKEYELTEVQKAFKEVTYSYYMRGKNAQYNSLKVAFHSPEEATRQRINYFVCSGLTRNVYRELLNVTIPETTNTLIEYSKNNIGSPEVIAYGYKKENGDFQMSFYDKDTQNVTMKINPSLEDIIPYLRCGDVLTYTGHTILIYDLIYDETGNVIDAYVMQSGHGTSNAYVKTKLPKSITIGDKISFGSANHFLYHNTQMNNLYMDGLEEGSINLTTIKNESTWNNINNPSKNNKEYSILRFIHQNEDGKEILKYKTIYEENDSFKDGDIIILPQKSKDRLKYSRLYIEKIVSAFAEDIVEANDELEYTLYIKNNSNQDYQDDIIVTENISEYVSYKDSTCSKSGIVGNYDGSKITWNIGKLKNKEEVVIQYRVIVKPNREGKIIESTGFVENIPSSVVRNTIGKNLSQSQAEKVQNSYEKLVKQYKGKTLMNEIYKDAIGIDLKIDNFALTDLIKDSRKNSISASTVTVDSANALYGAILNKYWGTLSQTNYSYENTNDIIKYDLKWFREYDDMQRRADTINSENFKTGDILIYQNSNDVNYSYSSKTGKVTTTKVTNEEGEYAYIFIEGKGFVGVNLGNDNLEGTIDDRNEFTAKYYQENGLSVYSNIEEKEEDFLEFANYQTLFGKDYYVILRPSLLDYFPQTGKNYRVEDKYYSSLEEAYCSIEQKGTIVVESNNTDSSKITIDQGKDITIDTNGMTVTKVRYEIINNGTLTILGNGTITTLEGKDNKLSQLIINNNGELIIKECTLKNMGKMSGNWYVIFSRGGNVTINDGSINACPFKDTTSNSDGRAIAIKNDAELIVNGGIIEANDGDIIVALSTSAGEVYGNISILGGRMIGKEGIILSGNKQYKNETNVQIKGGSIYTAEKGISLNEYTSGNLIVEAGEIISQNNDAIIMHGTGNLIIGIKDGKVSQKIPLIQGKESAINTKNGFHFYDGVLKGVSQVVTIENEKIVVEEKYETEETAELIDDTEYTIMQLKETKSFLKGDVNQDDKISLIDVRLLLQKVINNSYTDNEIELLDFNSDSKISLLDVRLLLQKVING